MKSRLKSLIALALVAWIPVAAAESAVTTNANVRAGPDRALPTVTWLLSGTSVTVVGCLANWRWCDVVAGRERGWVYSRYLSVPFQGSAIAIVDGGPNLGLPAIEFALGPYWDEHYRGGSSSRRRRPGKVAGTSVELRLKLHEPSPRR